MYNKVLEFWFNDNNRSKWFVKDPVFDQEIRATFSDIHAQATRSELWAWRSNPRGSLAEVIVLDQFSRNMYRGKAKSFHYDSLALALAQNAIARAFDTELTPEQRSFLYMPFMHSESLPIHEEAVLLFTKLGRKSNLEFELRHKAIIEKFGRYPHRNKILGRISTPEESQFLIQPGSGF